MTFPFLISTADKGDKNHCSDERRFFFYFLSALIRAVIFTAFICGS